MTTCYVLNASGTAIEVGDSVLNAAGTPIQVGCYILNAAGTPILWCIVVEDQQNAGGEDPEHKRRRYQLLERQKEDKLIISIVKLYMKNTI